MIELLMIADDFTGALDTGVHFSKAGGTVKVVTDVDFPLEQESEADVLVFDAETRHLESRAAYEVVYRIVKRAVSCGIPHIFKKTDSALRGNVGSELAALLEASGEKQLPFIPAFPGMNRVTKNGTQYIEGQPVAESVFGKDPFEPVRNSFIPDILRETADIRAECVPEGQEPAADFEGAAVYDAESVEYLHSLAEGLHHAGRLRIMAGCAGLAEVLPEILNWRRRSEELRVEKKRRFLVACGSVNPITRAQMDYAERNGFTRIHLTPEQKLQPGYWNGDKGRRELGQIRKKFLGSRLNIVDSNDVTGNIASEEYARKQNISMEELRTCITASIGCLVKSLMDSGIAETLMVMGGDTLLGFLKEIGVSEMRPVCELLPGTVLSEFFYKGDRYRIISKSGGFGSDSLLAELAELLIDMSMPYPGMKGDKEESIC